MSMTQRLRCAFGIIDTVPWMICLLSFDEDNLLQHLNEAKFKAVYMKIAANLSYNAAMIERFTSLRNVFNEPIGHTFALNPERDIPHSVYGATQPLRIAEG